MDKKMSVMGAGHKIAAVVVLYLALAEGISLLASPVFRITEQAYSTLLVTGIILAVTGFSLNLAAAAQMLKAHKAGCLATGGFYGIFLNPMYTLQVFITLPGLMLLFNSWLVMAAVIAAYVACRIFVREEEQYLESRFGDQYREYRRNVPVKFL